MAEGKLGITNATQGYDLSGIGDYIEAIRANLIEKAIVEMRSGKEKIKETVDTVWSGKSADIYKKNLDHDVDVICKALTEAQRVLNQSIWHAASQVKTIDENIVKERGV